MLQNSFASFGSKPFVITAFCLLEYGVRWLVWHRMSSNGRECALNIHRDLVPPPIKAIHDKTKKTYFLPASPSFEFYGPADCLSHFGIQSLYIRLITSWVRYFTTIHFHGNPEEAQRFRKSTNSVGMELIAHVIITLSRLLARLSSKICEPASIPRCYGCQAPNSAAYRRGDNRKEDHLLFRMELSQMAQLFPSIIIRAFLSQSTPTAKDLWWWLTKIRLANKLSLYVYLPSRPAWSAALGPNVTSLNKENAMTARH